MNDNVVVGYPENGARKIAFNDLAFFRAELEREYAEAVEYHAERFRRRVRLLLEDLEGDEG